jgi:acetyl-CoA carboxylase biotin carboxylase subunit
VFGGWRVPSQYDSLLAKLIAHAPTREQALNRMRHALDEFIIGGIRTNIDLHKRLIDLPEMRNGTHTTRTVENMMARGRA